MNQRNRTSGSSAYLHEVQKKLLQAVEWKAKYMDNNGLLFIQGGNKKLKKIKSYSSKAGSIVSDA